MFGLVLAATLQLSLAKYTETESQQGKLYPLPYDSGYRNLCCEVF